MARAISQDDYIPDIYEDLMAAPGPGGFFVAEQGGQVIACHCLQLTGQEDAYLWAMRVHPGLQGRGIGTMLCRAQVEQARAMGRGNVYLISDVQNLRAHRTVMKNGFANLGPWIIYEELTPAQLPSPQRVREGRVGDLPLARSFHHLHTSSRLGNVIASLGDPWGVRTMRADDWNPAEMAVIRGTHGVEGLLLYHLSPEAMQVRLLEGNRETSAELLAYAGIKAATYGCRSWVISIPAEAEELLAPLRLDPTKAHRFYVFCLHAGIEPPRVE
ncbi:MAG: GNAT family N-acetyltransferase [Mycobacterium leprae]